jgi:hypothetical protein
VAGLIDAERPPTGEPEPDQQAPSLVLNRPTPNIVPLHLRHERFHVVAHQVKLVTVVFVRRVDGDFRRREADNQPPASDINVRQPEHVAQKCAVSICVLAVDDGMRANQQGDLNQWPVASYQLPATSCERTMLVVSVRASPPASCRFETSAPTTRDPMR